MLRTLLEERFQLKVHSEKRQVRVYALVKSSKDPKLRKADQSEESTIAFRPKVQTSGQSIIELFSKNGTLEELASLLSKFMDRPVLNQTGIEGRFDFTVDYDSTSDAPGASSGPTGPGMFRAFRINWASNSTRLRGWLMFLLSIAPNGRRQKTDNDSGQG